MRDLESRLVEVCLDWFDQAIQIHSGQYIDDAGQLFRRARIDAVDFCMRVGAANEAQVNRRREFRHIVKKAAESTQQRIVLDPQDGLTDMTWAAGCQGLPTSN